MSGDELDLIHAYIEKTLSEEQTSQMLGLLRTDADFRARWVEYMETAATNERSQVYCASVTQTRPLDEAQVAWVRGVLDNSNAVFEVTNDVRGALGALGLEPIPDGME